MAIAYDSSNRNTAGSGTSISVTQTISGSDRIIFAASISDKQVSTVKIGTTNFTKIYENNVLGSYCSLWYLIAPPTGSQSIAFTFDSSGGMYVFTSSYTGVKQTGQTFPYGQSGQVVSPLNISVTTPDDNCRLVGVSMIGSGVVGSTNMTGRQNYFTAFFIADSNGPLTTSGVKTASYTYTTGQGGGIFTSISPVETAASTNASFLYNMI